MSFVDSIIQKLKQGQTGAVEGLARTLGEPPHPLGREETMSFVQSFPFWYHRIYLGHGIYTMPGPVHHEVLWERLKPTFPHDLKGASVLDVGSNAGFFSMQVKQIGAGQVVGLEPNPDYLKQAEVCRLIWGLDIEYRNVDGENLATIQEKFDLVIFAGILYHLKNPLGALETVSRLCRDAVILETEVISEDPRNCVYARQGPYGNVKVTACHSGFMKFVERNELNSDPSNWWIPDTECVLGMLRTAGFKYFSGPVYVGESRLLLLASKERASFLDLGALK